MSYHQRVLAGMEPWLCKRGVSKTVRARTRKQETWDSAIMAAAEYIRRRTGDEYLALAMLDLQTPIHQEAKP